MILPSSKNSNFPLKVRFKSCVKHNNGCLSCPFETCSKEGNYDMYGWRYDELIGYPVDTTQDPKEPEVDIKKEIPLDNVVSMETL